MTLKTTSLPRRAGRVGLAAIMLAATMAGAGLSSALAQQSPEPSEPSAEPSLQWAPLETLPPIAAPGIVSPVDLASGYTLGDPDAPVDLQVWEDFQCPFCQRFTQQVEPYIVETYVKPGLVKLTFRDLAFLGDESHWAAVAASLAADQDKFWPFHDYLFANLQGENVGSFHLDRLLAMGEAAGLDMDTFRAGLVLEAARARFSELQASSQADAVALGVSHTPALVLDGTLLEFDILRRGHRLDRRRCRGCAGLGGPE